MTLPVIIGIAGPHVTDAEREMLRIYAPRGVILFGRNIQNRRQVVELTEELRQLLPADGVLMLDQEGGRVARLRAPFWPDLPPAAALKTAGEAFAQGRAIGAMVRLAGFDVAAAPVLDLRYDDADAVIGDRAFSSDPAAVAELGGQIAAGIIAEGVIPVMKHIPGHGRARVDSHKSLPRISDADLDADFAPFIANNKLPWAMTAHIVYEAYDPVLPATLSFKVIKDVIREKIGFEGVLLSDDLAMGALSGSPPERAVAALAAGCDIALYCPGELADNLAVLRAVAAC